MESADYPPMSGSNTICTGIAGETRVGGRPAIVPTIAGQAWLTGVFQHGFDPSDPFRGGFTLPDMWFA